MLTKQDVVALVASAARQLNGCSYLLCDAILYDSGGIELQQALSGQGLDESQDGLLATLCTQPVFFLLVVDHLLQPTGVKKIKQENMLSKCRQCVQRDSGSDS